MLKNKKEKKRNENPRGIKHRCTTPMGKKQNLHTKIQEMFS